MRRGRHRFGGTQSGFHAAIEATQSALASLQSAGRHAQRIGSPVDYASGSAAQHPATANAVVRTEPQPGAEMLFAFESAHIGSHFGEQDQARQHANALNGAEINAKFL